MRISTKMHTRQPVGWVEHSPEVSMAEVVDAAGNTWRLREDRPGELSLSLATTGSGRMGGGIAVHPRADNSATVVVRP